MSAAQEDTDKKVSLKEVIREQTLIAHALGVKKVIVVINKFDTYPANLAEVVFKEFIADIKATLLQVGFDLSTIQFIAVSGLSNDNIVKKSDKLAWFNGPSLLDCIHQIPVP